MSSNFVEKSIAAITTVDTLSAGNLTAGYVQNGKSAEHFYRWPCEKQIKFDRTLVAGPSAKILNLLEKVPADDVNLTA